MGPSRQYRGAVRVLLDLSVLHQARSRGSPSETPHGLPFVRLCRHKNALPVLG